MTIQNIYMYDPLLTIFFLLVSMKAKSGCNPYPISYLREREGCFCKSNIIPLFHTFKVQLGFNYILF